MNKENLDRYAELKAQIKDIESEIEELKPGILADMKAAEADKIDHEAGSFVITKKKSWKFSDKVDAMKDAVKNLEADEKADGTATFEETEILMFKEKAVEV